MDTEVVIQHWLVAVVRSAALEGASELGVPSDTETSAAWEIVGMTTSLGPDELAQRVAAHYGLPLADLDDVEPHAHKLLPASVARRLRVVPLHVSDRILTVATSDPVSFEAEREIQALAGRSIHFRVAAPQSLQPAVDATYPAIEEAIHEIGPLEQEAKGGPRILVVDDDPDLRLLLRAALESAGYRVAEAENGPRALDLLADLTDPFSLVTLDLQMPGMDGREVLRTIRSRVATQTLPVVVATGSDDAETELSLFEAGADDFVVKPVDPPRFILRIQAVLRRHLRTGGAPA